MKTRTNKQNALLHYLLGKFKHPGISNEDAKDELIWQFTNERTHHSSEMTEAECQALIVHLEAVTGDKVIDYTGANTMRRKIISIAHQMGWHNNGKADMPRINAWCAKYGHNHRTLNEYPLRELPALVTQFEQVLKSYLTRKEQ